MKVHLAVLVVVGQNKTTIKLMVDRAILLLHLQHKVILVEMVYPPHKTVVLAEVAVVLEELVEHPWVILVVQVVQILLTTGRLIRL